MAEQADHEGRAGQDEEGGDHGYHHHARVSSIAEMAKALSIAMNKIRVDFCVTSRGADMAGFLPLLVAFHGPQELTFRLTLSAPLVPACQYPLINF